MKKEVRVIGKASPLMREHGRDMVEVLEGLQATIICDHGGCSSVLHSCWCGEIGSGGEKLQCIATTCCGRGKQNGFGLCGQWQGPKVCGYD